MEKEFTSISQFESSSQNFLETSKIDFTEEGLILLQETTNAVRLAIDKLNVFKQYINKQAELNSVSNLDINLQSRLTLEDACSSSQAAPIIQNSSNIKLQVFFTIPDNKITEMNVREAFEKEGFEDFIITIKNRTTHTFGFIKFSSEDSASQALRVNQKISINGHPMRIRHLEPSVTICQNENPKAVLQEINEDLLINAVCGSQIHRKLSTYTEWTSDKVQENEELVDNLKDNYYHFSYKSSSHSVDRNSKEPKQIDFQESSMRKRKEVVKKYDHNERRDNKRRRTSYKSPNNFNAESRYQRKHYRYFEKNDEQANYRSDHRDNKF